MRARTVLLRAGAAAAFGAGGIGAGCTAGVGVWSRIGARRGVEVERWRGRRRAHAGQADAARGAAVVVVVRKAVRSAEVEARSMVCRLLLWDERDCREESQCRLTLQVGRRGAVFESPLIGWRRGPVLSLWLSGRCLGDDWYRQSLGGYCTSFAKERARLQKRHHPRTSSSSLRA